MSSFMFIVTIFAKFWWMTSKMYYLFGAPPISSAVLAFSDTGNLNYADKYVIL
jgi:hypothetical protein